METKIKTSGTFSVGRKTLAKNNAYVKPTLLPVGNSGFGSGYLQAGNFTRPTNLDLLSLSSGYYSPADLLDRLIDEHPDVSKALNDALNLSGTNLTFSAENEIGVFDKKNDKWLKAFLSKLENDSSAEKSFVGNKGIRKIARQVGMSFLVKGATLIETMVDRYLEPLYFLVADSNKIKFTENAKTKKLTPWWTGGGMADDKKIDNPRIMFRAFDERINNPYGVSPFLPVLTIIWQQLTILIDLAQLAKKMFPKTIVKLDEAALILGAPADVARDPDASAKFIDNQLQHWKSEYQRMQAEDSYVVSSGVEIGVVESKSGGSWFDIRPLMAVIDQQIVAALKTVPSMLGRTVGKSATEGKEEKQPYVVGFLKYLQSETAEVLGIVLTRALWFSGRRGRVIAKFDSIDLRGESEIAQWDAIKIENTAKRYAAGAITFAEARKALRNEPGSLPVLTAAEEKIAKKFLIDRATSGITKEVERSSVSSSEKKNGTEE